MMFERFFDSRRSTGAFGEDHASKFLREKGYVILERNYRTRSGEVDIIALKRDTVVFVEVRTLRSRTFGSPKDSVGRRKERRIVMAAKDYLKKISKDKGFKEIPCRFDFIGIEILDGPPVIEHIENAFEAD